ncbi:hypothetical protein H9P43_000738 [Blastocladiella emersonii ATCC 22665]|nr:hypothetical protein H9P43_000738 [Blastocladiella emersonii ATCC 22665]
MENPFPGQPTADGFPETAPQRVAPSPVKNPIAPPLPDADFFAPSQDLAQAGMLHVHPAYSTVDFEHDLNQTPASASFLSPDGTPAAAGSARFLDRNANPAATKIITTDYRAPTHSQVNEERGAQSEWDATLRKCASPIQLRLTVSRLLSQSRAPKQVDLIAALNACARLALLGWKGVAPLIDKLTAETSAASSSGDRRANSRGGAPASIKTDPLPLSSVHKSQQYQRESFEVAQTIMQTLVERGSIPSLHIYSAYIRVCAHAGQADAAFQALDDMKRNGLVPDTEIYKGLVMVSARQGDVQRALEAVEISVQNASSVSRHAKWLKMALRLAVGVEAGKWVGILISLTTGMNEIATQIVGIGFGTVFGLRLAIPVLMPMHQQSASSKQQQQQSAATSSQITPTGSTPAQSPVWWKRLLDMLLGIHPQTFITPSPRPPGSAYGGGSGGTTTAVGFQAASPNAVFHSHDAQEVSQHMHAYLISVLETVGNVDAALTVLDEMRTKGIPVTVHTYNMLVEDLVQLGRPEVALATIAKMASVAPSSYTFLPVLRYHYDRRQFDRVVDVYETHMVPRGVPLDLVTYTSLISSFGKVARVDEAMALFDRFLREGFVPNQFVLNTLISILGKNGRFRDAEDVVLVTMPKYKVLPTPRSLGKLVDKARSLDPATYVPPESADFAAPPFPVLPGQPSPPPVQVQRSWFWYFRLRAVPNVTLDIVPHVLLMSVLHQFGYSHQALAVYSEVLGHTATSTPPATDASPPPPPPSILMSSDLAPLAPVTTQGYWAAAMASVGVPSLSAEHVVALVYEMKCRRLYSHPLPNPPAGPSGCPRLAELVASVVKQRHAPAATTAARPEPANVVIRRNGGILANVIDKVIAVATAEAEGKGGGAPAMDPGLPSLVLAMGDAFANSVRVAYGHRGYAESAPAADVVPAAISSSTVPTTTSRFLDDLEPASPSSSTAASDPVAVDEDDEDDAVAVPSRIASAEIPYSPAPDVAPPAAVAGLSGPWRQELRQFTYKLRTLRALVKAQQDAQRAAAVAARRAEKRERRGATVSAAAETRAPTMQQPTPEPARAPVGRTTAAAAAAASARAAAYASPTDFFGKIDKFEKKARRRGDPSSESAENPAPGLSTKVKSFYEEIEHAAASSRARAQDKKSGKPVVRAPIGRR